MTKERERFIDINTLSPEQAELISIEIGKRIGEIGDRAVQEINKITKIYGLEAKYSIQLVDIETGNVLSH